MNEQINVLTQQACRMVLEKILDSGYKDKLWIKKKIDLEAAEPILVCFPAKDNRQELMEELKTLFEKEELAHKNLPFSVETKNKISLEILQDKYRIPFFIEVEQYKEISLYPVEEHLGELTYYRFPTEEYLAQGVYEILDKLELLNNLSWYKEIYNILITETVDGRRVRDCFAKLLDTKKMPSFEKRLNTLKSYENYGYMKKKWKNEKKRHSGELPEWNQVLLLLVTFIEPIFEAVIRDEIFFEDWMPQLGRYL